MRTLFIELKKSKRRHNTLVAVCISCVVLLWATRTGGVGQERLEQGFSGLFYTVPLMNAVVMPLGMAVLASRLWDLESKEKNCRMLLTLQSRGELFCGKAGAALLQILLIGVIESGGILALGKRSGFTEVMDRGQFWWLFVSTCSVNIMLFFLWFCLSIRFEHQVPALSAGMVGSLSGLFSAFMPSMVSRLLPWGYYIPLSTVRIDWNPETKIVRYFHTSYPVWMLILTIVFAVLAAVTAWETLKHKEV